ncbi:class I SAM-dependent methyltransferase [Pradoshia sp. D12]|uniref:class I SAM-dependent methyltransferase n=1 Tax=Bacillaceae TaxID=186817 RepID=UPI00080AEDC8|nr:MULTISPECIES: class I SAM-dependent methyltransferase [Bacillaceae]OCA86261.1 methyltransferase [Bacillus sp. FJAT-27986]QFK72057.1 class I SAM-dependent methyltransferase [Pradoshia sp. D12]TPF71451.1 class I SAM-dependent methyltransferase [Bacillus sp. D12]
MNEIVDYYSEFDEWGRLDREPIEFQVNWHYIKKYLTPSGTVLDNGAGPGKYSLKLAEEGYRVTLSDLTPSLVDIAEDKARELGLFAQFDGFYNIDARDLSAIEDEQFDASLMLGPLYHLQQEEDRLMAVKELYRVTKKNGLVFIAFMPRVKHMLNSLICPEHWRPNNTVDAIRQFTETGCFNHADSGRFTGAYYYRVEDIDPFMKSSGFEKVALIGSNIGSMVTNHQWNYWREKGEGEMGKIVDLLIEYAKEPSLLGTSSHLLYIGLKK